MGIRYFLENIFVICVIVGLCFLIIVIVILISIFIFRWCYIMLCEYDFEDFRYDNIIIFSYEGDSFMWIIEGIFWILEEI